MTIRGTVVNGVVLLDSNQRLPEGARVEIVFQEAGSPPNGPETTLAQRLMKLAGTVKDLPSDMARNHNHYIHGTLKR
jgi:hypothetical protein